METLSLPSVDFIHTLSKPNENSHFCSRTKMSHPDVYVYNWNRPFLAVDLWPVTFDFKRRGSLGIINPERWHLAPSCWSQGPVFNRWHSWHSCLNKRMRRNRHTAACKKGCCNVLRSSVFPHRPVLDQIDGVEKVPVVLVCVWNSVRNLNVITNHPQCDSEGLYWPISLWVTQTLYYLHILLQIPKLLYQN